MNEVLIEKIFPGAIKNAREGKCALCGSTTLNFRDDLSRKEYAISRICQECQDKIFG